MATVLSTMYPPSMDTYQPANLISEDMKIYFSVSSYDSDKINNIQYVHVSLVYQSNNQTAFAITNDNDTVYPSYYPIGWSNVKKVSDDQYYLIIPSKVIRDKTFKNILYKVQIRFDLNSEGAEQIDFFEKGKLTSLATYLNNNSSLFTEWSKSSLIKPINEPTIKCNQSVYKTSTEQIIISFDDGSEKVKWYQLYKGEKTITDILYPENNTIAPIVNVLNNVADEDENFTFTFKYETTSGYIGEEDFSLSIIDFINLGEPSITPAANDENGVITITITLPQAKEEITNNNDIKSGNVILRRTSVKDKYSKWEELKTWESVTFNKTLIFYDDTVESLTLYKYSVQLKTDKGYSAPVIMKEPIGFSFYDASFKDKDRALILNYNFTITQRALNKSRSIVDTLGGKYPILTKNGKLEYHTYSFSAMITFNSDAMETFTSKEELLPNGWYDYYAGNVDSDLLINTTGVNGYSLDYDWIMEREYRNLVEEWMNNSEPKLFRSMTEGNMIIVADGVTMTPEKTLGRRIYNLSGTMYEIGNADSLESLRSFGIVE